MKDIRTEILDYLRQQSLEGKEFVYDGAIQDVMRTRTGSKGETTGRLLRFLRHDGLVESEKIDTGFKNEKGEQKKALAYRLSNAKSMEYEVSRRQVSQMDLREGQDVRVMQTETSTDCPNLFSLLG